MLKLLALAYVAYVALLVVAQRRIVFAGTSRPAPAHAPRHDGDTWWLEAQGARVEAWYFAAPNTAAPAPALLFAHGNYELIDDWVAPFQAFRALGLAVLLVEYPGYGRSSGEPSEAALATVMTAAYRALAARPEIDATRIVAYGRSLGGGAVGALLDAHAPAAVVLQSTFSSLAPFAHARGVPSFVLRDRFDTAAALARYGGPALIVHGTHDSLIPHAHAERLLRAAKHGRLLDYAADHNDCPPDWDAFVTDVATFLNANGVLPARTAPNARTP